MTDPAAIRASETLAVRPSSDYGPTYEAMLHGPDLAYRDIDRVGWHGPALVLPGQVTGVEARIVVLPGYTFPSGSHEVAATTAMVMEAEAAGRVIPGTTRLVTPSTGNFGIGMAWTAFQKGYRATVVMPEGVHPERVAQIRAYGGDVVFVPQSECVLMGLVERARALSEELNHYSMAQFEDFASYRFHYYVTGSHVLETVPLRIAAFVAAPGSAGTLAAGDRIKERFPQALNVAADSTHECLLLDGSQVSKEATRNKMVPLIANVGTLDRIVTVDDLLCVDLMYWFVTALGYHCEFGLTGIRNIIAAIKLARAEKLGPDDVVVTVASDGVERYRDTLESLEPRTCEEAARLGPKRLHALDPREGYVDVSTPAQKKSLHALKTATWSRWYSVEFLASLEQPATWQRERDRVSEFNLSRQDQRPCQRSGRSAP